MTELDKKIEESVYNKIFSPPFKLMMLDLIQYYQKLIEEGKSYKSAQQYINTVTGFLRYRFGDEIPEDYYHIISSRNIQDYLEQIKTKISNDTPSNATKATSWTGLQSFFQFLNRERIFRNPMDNIARPQINKSSNLVYLTSEEIKLIFQNVRKTANRRMMNRDLCMIMLGLYCGFNGDAIVQANLDDVDLDKNTIKLPGKKKHIQLMPLSPAIANQIKAWKDDRQLYFGDAETNALFVSQEKKRLSIKTLQVVIHKYSQGMNKVVTTQVMRNTCVVNLYKETGDLVLCSKYLNHSSTAVTQRYIDRLIDNNDIESAACILDEIYDTATESEEIIVKKTQSSIANEQKCAVRVEIFQEIAKANGLVFKHRKCQADDCDGRCGAIEESVRELELQLNRMKENGTGIHLAKYTCLGYDVGDMVLIIDGPLSDFTGMVQSVDSDMNTVNVVVSLFGREVSLELEIGEVAKIKH